MMRYLVVRHALDLRNCTEQELFRVLDEIRKTHSLRYYSDHVKYAKRALRWLGRKELAEKLIAPKDPDPEGKVKRALLKPEEVKQLIGKAGTRQDRLLIELLYETGARRGELFNLRIQDVQFDEMGGIIFLSGKTETRRRRIYASTPDLREHLNNHPYRNDADAKVFINRNGQPLAYSGFYRYVRQMGIRILGRPIYPHQFRHTKATEDSSYFTDRELMLLFGWRTPDVIKVYSHLSMRDVEDKDLVLHGLKRRQEILRPLVNVMVCEKCKAENAPIALYCHACGSVLAKESTREAVQEEVRRILREEYPQLVKELAKEA
jgi:integrase/ribosomal protein L40E